MRASNTATPSILYPVALVLMSILSFQVGASLAKSVFPLVGGAGAAALRLGLGSLLLLAVFRPWRAPLRGWPWKALASYGLVMGLMNSLFYLALQSIPLGIAVALEFTGPLGLAIFASRRRSELLWGVLAVVGLLLLVPWSERQAHLDPAGCALALGAGVCWALYIVLGQKANTGHAAQSVAVGSCFAALVAVPWGFANAGGALLSPALLPAGLGVAVLSMALPYTLEMIAMARLPASTFGLLMSLEPAIGALCGLAFLHERLTLLQWLAIATIIVASAGATRGAQAAVPIPD